MTEPEECEGCGDCQDESDRVNALAARIRQLERDYEYLMAAVTTANTRIAAMDERQRRQELAASRGVR